MDQQSGHITRSSSFLVRGEGFSLRSVFKGASGLIPSKRNITATSFNAALSLAKHSQAEPLFEVGGESGEKQNFSAWGQSTSSPVTGTVPGKSQSSPAAVIPSSKKTDLAHQPKTRQPPSASEKPAEQTAQKKATESENESTVRPETDETQQEPVKPESMAQNAHQKNQEKTPKGVKKEESESEMLIAVPEMITADSAPVERAGEKSEDVNESDVALAAGHLVNVSDQPDAIDARGFNGVDTPITRGVTASGGADEALSSARLASLGQHALGEHEDSASPTDLDSEISDSELSDAVERDVIENALNQAVRRSDSTRGVLVAQAESRFTDTAGTHETKSATVTSAVSSASTLGADRSLGGETGISSPRLNATVTRLNTPFHQVEWSEMMQSRVRWMIQSEIKSATIYIDPPELGPIHVKIHHTADQTQVTFHVNNQAVKEALEQSAHRLRDALADQHMAQVDVNVRRDGHEGSSDRNPEAPANGWDESLSGNEDDVLGGREHPISDTMPGLINTFV